MSKFVTLLVTVVVAAAFATTTTASASVDPVARKSVAQLRATLTTHAQTNVKQISGVQDQVGATQKELDSFEDYTVCMLILGNDIDQMFFRVISLMAGLGDPGVDPVDDKGTCARAGIERTPPTYMAMTRANMLFDSTMALRVGAILDRGF